MTNVEQLLSIQTHQKQMLLGKATVSLWVISVIFDIRTQSTTFLPTAATSSHVKLFTPTSINTNRIFNPEQPKRTYQRILSLHATSSRFCLIQPRAKSDYGIKTWNWRYFQEPNSFGECCCKYFNEMKWNSSVEVLLIFISVPPRMRERTKSVLELITWIQLDLR